VAARARQGPLSFYTCALRRKAEELGGKYDGWGTNAMRAPGHQSAERDQS